MLTSLLTAASLTLAAAPAASGPPTMPVADLQRGMKCVGRTVYEGTRIEEFGCEILGVLPGAWGPGDDVIVARLTGPNADRYGIAAGMSGSPVFVDGKLIGALSLSLGTFQREPIAGITPIDAMQRVRSSTGWPMPRGGADAGGSPIESEPRTGGGARGHDARDFDPTALRPILTPIVVSGITPEAMPIARTLLEPHGFVLTAGAGAGADLAAAPAPNAGDVVLPGGALAGLLVTGDVNIAATGTVTWRDESTLLAFGHSFLLYGNVEMPMAAAEIVATVPSQAISFKLGAPRTVVGAVLRDNRTAIAGRFGEQARMIPVKVTLPEGTTPREIRFSVFRNRVLTAPMLTVGVMNGLVSNAAYDAEGSVRLDGRVKVAGFPDIVLSRTYFDPGQQGGSVPAIASEIAGMLQRLFDNELAEASVTEVELALGVEKGRRETRIDAAWTERATVKPGETVGVRVRMRPFRGVPQVQELSVKIPEGTPPGLLMVTVADAKVLDAKDRVAPGFQTRADDLGALISSFNQRRDEDSVYLRLSRATPGAVVRGVNLPSLPPTALGVVRGAEKSAGGADPLADAILFEARSPQSARVSGSAELTLRVE